jgi:hypothetical protein
MSHPDDKLPKNNDAFEVEEGQEVVRRTIVGGRPRARRKRKIAIPIGIEKLLARAAGDKAFKRALLANRYVAVEAQGFSLVDSERAILESVSDAVLGTLIGRIDLKRHAKRRFMKGVATAAFATVAMTTGVACENSTIVGSTDTVGEQVDTSEVMSSVGSDVQPDVPEIFPDAGVDIQPDVPPNAGVSPDVVDVQEWEISAGVDIGEPEPMPEVTEVMEIDGEGPQVGGITPEIDEE